MKPKSQRRSLIATVFQRSLILFLFLVSFSAVAQILPPNPLNTEYPYPPAPPPPPVSLTNNTHNYSFFGTWPGVGMMVWLQVSSWDGPGNAGFAWQAVDMVTGVIYDQGFFNYPLGVSDLNVGVIITAGPIPQIDVSYHLAGTGHFVDVWNWNKPVFFGGPGGILPAFSNQLSCIANYTRISMDCHKGYGTAVVWEDPMNGGISVEAANGNAFGPPFTFVGTAGHITPDVAFTHDNGTGMLQIHAASYLAGTGIVEYFVPWPLIIPGGPLAVGCGVPPPCTTCALPNIVEDINFVGTAPNNLTIDAPDHYVVANWAYTYEIANDIYARIMNWNPGAFPMPSFAGIPATVCFTNGSYAFPVYPPGLPVINGFTNDRPVICWDRQNMTGNPSFYVAWHTSFIDPLYNPTSNAYIAIQIQESGLISNPLFPFAFFGASLTPTNISPTPSVALDKQNDISPYMYEVFSEFNSGSFWLEHRWIPWSSGSFKPGTNTSALMEAEHDITVSPNPFKDVPRLNVPEELSGETISVKVSDIMGKTYGVYDKQVAGVNAFLADAAKNMVPGNYIINVDCKKINFHKAFKVTKSE